MQTVTRSTVSEALWELHGAAQDASNDFNAQSLQKVLKAFAAVQWQVERLLEQVIEAEEEK